MRASLYLQGVGYVWENQGVQNDGKFLFKQCLVNFHKQDWNCPASQSLGFILKLILCWDLHVKPYLYYVNNKVLRIALTRFRIEMSDVRTLNTCTQQPQFQI